MVKGSPEINLRGRLASERRRKENKELLRVLDPFARVVEIQKRLPNPFHDNTLDDTPLRDVLPGSWPTMKDIRALHAFAVAHGWKCK